MDMAGGAQTVIDRTVGYLKDRHQFGRPVASKQRSTTSSICTLAASADHHHPLAHDLAVGEVGGGLGGAVVEADALARVFMAGRFECGFVACAQTAPTIAYGAIDQI
ncbi:hypothetical protein ACE10Z_35340 [Bradyrhizobium sp. Pha-3]|uniref:hypothetical protein n=1 Tax=Bradyrhizobium sp. Pha-3 TaxID=208375 RepID=UPI0035D3E439